MTGLETTPPVFLTIIVLYVAFSLFILGAKKAYFEPWQERIDPSSERSKSGEEPVAAER